MFGCKFKVFHQEKPLVRETTMYYRPRFSNGQLVPISWFIKLYRRLNHICWPLEDNVNRATIILDYGLGLMGFMIFMIHEDAAIRYIRSNLSNIDEWTKALPSVIIECEILLRGFHCMLHKTNLKRLLQKYYATIYISQNKHPGLYKVISQQLRFTFANGIMYLLSLTGFFCIPIHNLLSHRKDFLFPMIPAIDITPLYLYIPLTVTSIWIGLMVNSMVIGELTLIAEFLMHLNARFIMLRQDLLDEFEDTMSNCHPMIMAKKYRETLVRIMKRNVELNHFAGQVEILFTFRIFVLFALSAILMCLLCYKVYTNPSDVSYILWLLAKIIELLNIGNLGSTLERTSNDISNMYYECNWEQIIYKSKNTRENMKLMKLIVLAIEINSRPVYLTGMNYFRITLQTVLKILQGAFSYFTFITSMGNN